MESTISNATLVRAPGDWRDILALRQCERTTGVLTPYVGKSALFGTPVLIEPAIDPGGMSATAVISTPTPDRSDDIVEPLGVRLTNYARNPVVYFDHGLSGITLPIGKSENEAGDLTVTVTADGIEATSYFAQSMCEACQIFDLIQQKIVRSTSINMTPLVARVRSEGSGSRPGLHIEEWELLEWSWVGIPDNPEAVRKVLDCGKLAGSPICESIRKCLLPFADHPKMLGRGMPLGDSVTDDERLRCVAEPKISPAGQGAAPLREDASKEDRERSGTSRPCGSKVLADAFNGLWAVASALEGPIGAAEHRGVKSFCEELAAALRGAMHEVQACHLVHFPDHRLASELKLLNQMDNLNLDQQAELSLAAPSVERSVDDLGQAPIDPTTSVELPWIGRINDRLELIERKMTGAAAKLLEAIPNRRP